jgi:hypothetical protein
VWVIIRTKEEYQKFNSKHVSVGDRVREQEFSLKKKIKYQQFVEPVCCLHGFIGWQPTSNPTRKLLKLLKSNMSIKPSKQ